jgi:hypothetical protein
MYAPALPRLGYSRECRKGCLRHYWAGRLVDFGRAAVRIDDQAEAGHPWGVRLAHAEALCELF